MCFSAGHGTGMFLEHEILQSLEESALVASLHAVLRSSGSQTSRFLNLVHQDLNPANFLMKMSIARS